MTQSDKLLDAIGDLAKTYRNSQKLDLLTKDEDYIKALEDRMEQIAEIIRRRKEGLIEMI